MNEALPRGWVFDNLKNIVNSVKTGVPEFTGKKQYFSTGSIQNSNISSEGNFNHKNRPSRANRIAVLNDVFQARMKETNKGIIADNSLDNQLFSTGFLQLRPYGNTYHPKLLYYYINSSIFLDQRDNLATGSTQEALTDTNAVNLIFPLPPLEEQKEIVRQVDKLFALADKVEARYQNAKARMDKLSQSVLAKVFRGELVITEAELAEKEGREFESAAKLLERIEAEKAKMEVELKVTKKKRKK